jgi:hypothetical protein
MKPTIQQFTLSLLYPNQREAIGLHLTADQAAALLRAPDAAAQYYDQWAPTNVPRMRSAVQDAIDSKPKLPRHIIAKAVLIPLAIVFAAVIGLAGYGVIQAVSHPTHSIFQVPTFTPGQ